MAGVADEEKIFAIVPADPVGHCDEVLRIPLLFQTQAELDIFLDIMVAGIDATTFLEMDVLEANSIGREFIDAANDALRKRDGMDSAAVEKKS